MFELFPEQVFMNRIKKLLSAKWISILFTILSVIASNCWQQVLPNFDVDNSYSVAAAKYISAGRGYGIVMASPDDLSKFYFKPLNKWPPGQSWLIFLIHAIFPTDWIHATYLLNVFGLTFLILVFRRLLIQLEFPLWLVNPAVLFFGFFEYTFHFSNNTDITALLLYLTALSVSLSLVKSGKSILKRTILAGFLLGASAFIKYLYIPLAFVPIISIWIYGYLINNKEFRSAAFKGFLFTFFMILSMLAFQYMNSGNSVYINPSKTGFFPAQLLWLAAVVPSSFVNLNFVNMQLSIRGQISYEQLNIFWSVVNLGCIIWIARAAFKIFREKVLRSPDYRSFYAIHAILLTFTLFGFLSLLSVLKGKKYSDSFATWVYVGELRYYLIFSVLLLQFGLLVWLRPEYFFKIRNTVLLQWIFILVSIEEVSHGFYFQIKQIAIKNNYGLRQQHDQVFFETGALVNKLSEKNVPLVFASNSQELANSAALQGIPVMYDPGQLGINAASSQPVTLIIAVDSRVPGQVVPLLQTRSAAPDLILDTVKFYILDLQKNAGT